MPRECGRDVESSLGGGAHDGRGDRGESPSPPRGFLVRRALRQADPAVDATPEPVRVRKVRPAEGAEPRGTVGGRVRSRLTNRPGLSTPVGSNSVLIRRMSANACGSTGPQTSMRSFSASGHCSTITLPPSAPRRSRRGPRIAGSQASGAHFALEDRGERPEAGAPPDPHAEPVPVSQGVEEGDELGHARGQAAEPEADSPRAGEERAVALPEVVGELAAPPPAARASRSKLGALGLHRRLHARDRDRERHDRHGLAQRREACRR